MDTQKILSDSLRIWNTTPRADLDSAVWVPAARADPLRAGFENALLLGDNLALMASLSARLGAGAARPFNLVYMDPPYFSNRNYDASVRALTPTGEVVVRVPAFSDKWRSGHGGPSFEESMDEYLMMLAPRLVAARELLAEDGCLWLHLDRRAVHYAKVLADAVFESPDNMINEIVWTYKSGGASGRRCANKHDTLLFYAKDHRKYKFFPQEEKSYNRDMKPYRFKGVSEHCDDAGWYTLVNMKDVWEIPMVGRTAGERTGYATQKPEALLERVLRACTEKGDLCLDPFAGSGTLAAVCAKHGRNWMCIDENPLAVETAAKRLGNCSMTENDGRP
jgi:DNA modification methylase